MATLKMSGCMKLVSKMSQADQDLLLQRLDDYQAEGVPAEVAQNMAARDTLAELQTERTQLEKLLREQHPDLFEAAEPAPPVEDAAQTQKPAPAATKSTRRTPLGFYSALADGIDGVKTNAAPAAGWKDAIKGLVNKGQVKADEVQWTGINEWLDLQQGRVTREQVQEYLAANGVQVQETVLSKQDAGAALRKQYSSMTDEEVAQEWAAQTDGDPAGMTRDRMVSDMVDIALEYYDQNPGDDGGPKYGRYGPPGGTNYREVLLTLPPKVIPHRMEVGRGPYEARQSLGQWYVVDRFGEWGVQGYPSREAAEAAFPKRQFLDTQTFAGEPYESRHWGQPNVLAHLRVDDRTDADGKRVLFIREIQSDWGQEGKKKGFGGEPRYIEGMEGQPDGYLGSTVGPPRAPFVGKTDAWVSLALKRAIVMAAEQGYDKVAIINGEQAADMFDLSKQVKSIYVERYDLPSVGSVADIRVIGLDGQQVHSEDGASMARIEELIGKEMAQRIADQEPETRKQYAGDGLKVGGKGMRSFYDGIVPKIAKDVVKKLGGQVGLVNMVSDPNPALDQWEAEDGAGDGSRAPIERTQQLGFDITPEMREKVQAGVPLFSPRRNNIFGQQLPQPLATWTKPTDSKFDDFVHKMQDKQIDTKRVLQAIKAASGQLDEEFDAYEKETLYHGRTAKQTKDFLLTELRPLMQDMAARKIDMAEFEEYLHNRHAQERNEQIAKINPRFPDGGSGIDTADARAFLAGLAPAKRQALEALAQRVDRISAGTRKLLVDSGLETQETIDKWEAAYGKYVPLYREDVDFGDASGPGTGQGYSVRGPASQRATGSSRPVVDILANLAMQRERTIVRAEKNRVAQAVYGLAVKAPNTEFWLAVDPAGQKDPNVAMADLMAMGIDPADAKNIIEEPTQAHVDARTGLVSYRINPRLRGSDHVLAMRIDGRDKFVFFNNNDARGKRMAEALKNLDADQLGQLMSLSATVTRYFSSVNTQYNPIFGAVNLLRDVQGAMFNLSTTPLAGDKAKVLAGVPKALRGIYADLRAERRGQPNNKPPGSYAQLWEEFQREGGQTGFRAMFSQSQERAEALQRELDPSSWADTKVGKFFTAGGRLKAPLEVVRKNAWGPVFDWLSDFNETIENSVRLSAYKTAKDKGLSNQQAASIAKNLTVNFNRKGQIGTQAGALYAFFNASVQGTARLGELMFDMPQPGDPKSIRLSATGQKILAGGLLLGTIQALALAAAGFDEDEPPDYVKERNLVIPLGASGKYLQVPMPLGLNVIPNVSRNLTEYFLGGRRDPAKYLGRITGAFFEMFNPIGSAGWSIQTLTPTVMDPLAALSENRDYTGKPIAKQDMSSQDPTPGFTRSKETASALSKFIAKYLNLGSGGTMYKPGIVSPTPDQIDYLIGQVTGGVGRELMKVEQSLTSQVSGEELPPYKIPLAGRFYGDTAAGSSEANRFYENVRRLNEHENEIRGRQKDRKPVQDYLQTYPEARLFQQANSIERQVSELRKRKQELLARDASKETIKLVETRITARMKQLNDAVKRQREREPAN